MLKSWNVISNIGIKDLKRDTDKRNVLLTNRIVTILFLFNWVLYIVSVFINGIAFINTAIALANVFSITSILYLNHIGKSIWGRLLLSWMVSIVVFIITLFSKMNDPDRIDELFYVTPRLFILATSIIPLLIFSFHELRALILSLLGSLIPILFFDPIHNFLGIGYYDLGFNSGSYPFAIVLSITCYCLFIASGIFFKRINERYELKNETLITSLQERNLEFHAQSNELKIANAEIQSNNKNLEEVVVRRTKKVQEQASKFRQFSQKNSHDLRAPLTNIMSLLDQLKTVESADQKEHILNYLERACFDLDKVIHEINEILANPENDD